MKRKKQQVIFIHGGETFEDYESYVENLKAQEFDPYKESAKKWKESLAEELGDGFEVIMPRMPSKYNAKYKEWKIWFDKVADFAEESTVLIGHSLGGLFLAKYLSENKFPKSILAVYLLAAPYDSAEAEDSLADFGLPRDLSGVEDQAKNIFIYHSRDDFVVPFEESKKYEKALPSARPVVFEDKNHFLQETFPELIESIKSLK